VARAVPGHVRWARELRPVLGRAGWLAVAAGAGLVLGLWVTPQGVEQAARGGAVDGSAVGLADEEEVGQAREAEPEVAREAVTLEMPQKPLPGQLRAPCNPEYEDEIRGGCWVPLAKKKPPCGKGSYEWKGACYWPKYPAMRPDTSAKP